MTLDPQLAAFLASTADEPPLERFPPPEARARFERGAALMQAAAAPLPEVGSTEDDTLGALPVRVYRPVGDDHPRPTVLFVHGGGWVIGSIASHDDQARRLCRDLDAVVVALDYRLAPEHPFPAAVDDVTSALRWVVDQVSGLGGDAERIAVAGDSAGGNLAAVAAQWARDNDIALAGQLLVYPATDLGHRYPSLDENAEGYFLTRDETIWFTRSCLGDDVKAVARDPRASPLQAATLAGLAPAVVVTAQYDPIRDDGEAYAAALERAGVPVVARRFDGLIHGFFGMTGLSAACEAAVAWTVAEFGRLLHP